MFHEQTLKVQSLGGARFRLYKISATYIADTLASFGPKVPTWGLPSSPVQKLYGHMDPEAYFSLAVVIKRFRVWDFGA